MTAGAKPADMPQRKTLPEQGKNKFERCVSRRMAAGAERGRYEGGEDEPSTSPASYAFAPDLVYPDDRAAVTRWHEAYLDPRIEGLDARATRTSVPLGPLCSRGRRQRAGLTTREGQLLSAAA